MIHKSLKDLTAIFRSVPFFNISVLRADSFLFDVAIRISCTFCSEMFLAIFSIKILIRVQRYEVFSIKQAKIGIFFD